MPFTYEYEADWADNARERLYRLFGRSVQQEWKRGRNDVVSREARETAKAVEEYVRSLPRGN